jgi:hypothetical protein
MEQEIFVRNICPHGAKSKRGHLTYKDELTDNIFPCLLWVNLIWKWIEIMYFSARQSWKLKWAFLITHYHIFRAIGRYFFFLCQACCGLYSKCGLSFVLWSLGTWKLLVTEYRYEKWCKWHWKIISKVYQQIYLGAGAAYSTNAAYLLFVF